MGSGAKPDEFVAEDLDIPSMDELAIAAARQKADRHDRYARLPLALIDSTTAGQRRARHIVMRAVEAMGGMSAMAGITSLRTRVWVEAHEHVVPGYTIPKKMFLYPVETWSSRADSLSVHPVAVQPSLDTTALAACYQFYNPLRTLGNYRRLISSI